MKGRDPVMFSFGEFEADPAAFRLLRRGEPVRIEPKALALLIFLVENRGRVVSKQELLDAVWKDTAVTENALTRVIAHLRRVLGDDADAPRYVQTVPTKGYRFIAEAVAPPVAAAVTPAAAARRPRRWSWALAAVAMVAAMAVAGTWAMLQLVRAADAPHLRAKIGGKIRPPSRRLVGRPIRPDTRLQAFPSFSPDGRSIAYSADDGGVLHIYTSAINGEDERQITHGDDGQTQPSWSADGKWIAYVSVTRGGIWVVPAEGGEARQLTRFGARPAWSPSGDEIAFQSGDLIDYGWTASDALPPSTLWVVDVSTGRTSQLTKSGMPAGGHGAPSWRRDGAVLTFTSCELELCGVYTLARDGAPPVRVFDDPRRLSSPVFGRDGNIIYCLQLLYSASVMLEVRVTAGGHPAGGPAPLRSTAPGVMQHLAVSPDGRQFAWSVVEERSDLVSVDIGSGASHTLTRNVTGRALFPAFSPDGSKIAYSATAAGDDSGIWVMTSDGSGARAVAAGPGLKQHPQWSGEWNILYGAWQNAVGGTLYKVSLIDGRTAPIAVLPSGGSAPALSPDGSTVAFNRTVDGTASVWTMRGRDATPLSAERDLARFPVWSPSGRLIAVQARTRLGVGVLPADGGSMRLLPFDGESWPYAWSPDEKQIAFAGRRAGRWSVWTIDAASGATRAITTPASMIEWVRTPAWSPRGDRIVYEHGISRGTIWISQDQVAG